MQICPSKPARSVLLSFVVLAALLLAACGNDSGGDSADAGPDPATVTPAGALLYFEATVRPQGSQKDDLLSALSKLLGEDDPGAAIRAQVEQTVADEGYSYSEDVEPWLGSRAGLFLTEVSADDADGAATVAVTDQGAAEETVQRLIEDGGESAEPASYEGTDYTLVGDGAVGFVGEFLVVGTEPGFEAVVDASSTGSLSDDDTAADALASVPEGSLFKAYVDGDALLNSLVDSGVISEKDLEGVDLEPFVQAPVVFSGAASSDSFSLEFSGPAGEGTEAPASVSGLPGQAWFALAVPMIGEIISSSYDQFVQSLEQSIGKGFEVPGSSGFEGLPGGPAAVPPELLDIGGQIEDATGLDLSKDLDWAGDLSLFVQGDSLFSLGGGVVISSSDDEAAAAAVEKLGRALRRDPSVRVTPTAEGFAIQIEGAPVPAEVAVRDGNVVLAIAGAGVDAVLDPTETLADAAGFSAASNALGEDLDASFFVDLPSIVRLIESTGGAEGDPDYEQARQYLEAISFIIAGGRIEGDGSIARFVLGVQEASSSSSTSSGEAAALVP